MSTLSPRGRGQGEGADNPKMNFNVLRGREQRVPAKQMAMLRQAQQERIIRNDSACRPFALSLAKGGWTNFTNPFAG